MKIQAELVLNSLLYHPAEALIIGEPRPDASVFSEENEQGMASALLKPNRSMTY
ncbi:MAG TPA: hypothetical protein PLG54_05170 [Bacteroidales bacterium]|jgi:hypothetical protein|nr:hypothetical protein [Bacteroidales bacterium]MBP9511892.1 hypothetical protein [Bacteroidales bacterium]HNQ59876.1 hypothetical protein [Bacteroidales bacterium]HNU21840.1 hypothetical protein [Bacteroidales bacterium]HNV17065.1 hypothetical protein [Bacteroidales bacterium]